MAFLMKKQTGFKPLPPSLKVIFIFNAIGLGLSALGFFAIAELFRAPTFFFTFPLLGWPAVIFGLLIVVAKIILLIIFLKRSPWTWGFSIGYFGLLILNGLINLFILKDQISTQADYSELPEFAQNFGFAVGFATAFLMIGMYVTFLTFITLRRGYFQGKSR